MLVFSSPLIHIGLKLIPINKILTIKLCWYSPSWP